MPVEHDLTYTDVTVSCKCPSRILRTFLFRTFLWIKGGSSLSESNKKIWYQVRRIYSKPAKRLNLSLLHPIHCNPPKKGLSRVLGPSQNLPLPLNEPQKTNAAPNTNTNPNPKSKLRVNINLNT